MEREAIYTMPIPFGPALCELQGREGGPVGGILCQVAQYVTAYRVEPEKLAALLPPGFSSLRPVLRLNVELLSQVAWLAGRTVYRVELNTPVQYKGKRGWLNLVTWENNVDAVLAGRDVYGIPKLYADITAQEEGPDLHVTVGREGFAFLEMTFHRVGVEGGCPKEADNEGTFHPRYLPNVQHRNRGDVDYTAFTAVETIDAGKEYCDCTFTWHTPTWQQMPAGYSMVEAICAVPCQEVLGAYAVAFPRTKDLSDQVVL